MALDMVQVMDTVVMVQDTVLDTDILEVTLVMECMDRDMVLEWVVMAAVLAKVIDFL